MQLLSPDEIDRIERAGRLLWSLLAEQAKAIRPGQSTQQIVSAMGSRIVDAGARPAMDGACAVLGTPAPTTPRFPAPASVCIDDEAMLAVPGSRAIEPGSCITLDAAIEVDGRYADAAIAAVIEPGPASADAQRLVEAARQTTERACLACRAGRRWSQVARLIASTARGAGCGVVAGYAGHGVGRSLHTPPALPIGLADPRRPGASGDPVLTEGMVLSIEPILTLGSGRVSTARDGWTVRTMDGSLACFEEWMVAVGPRGGRVLAGPESGEPGLSGG